MWRVKALVNATWAFKDHSTTPQYLNWLLKRNVEEHPRTHKQIFPLLFDFVILCQWADFNRSHTHTRTYVCYVQNTHTSSLIPQPAELADLLNLLQQRSETLCIHVFNSDISFLWILSSKRFLKKLKTQLQKGMNIKQLQAFFSWAPHLCLHP